MLSTEVPRFPRLTGSGSGPTTCVFGVVSFAALIEGVECVENELNFLAEAIVLALDFKLPVAPLAIHLQPVAGMGVEARCDDVFTIDETATGAVVEAVRSLTLFLARYSVGCCLIVSILRIGCILKPCWDRTCLVHRVNHKPWRSAYDFSNLQARGHSR